MAISTWRSAASEAAIPLLSGVLLALCFPPFDMTWVAWIALVPWAAAISRSRASFELYLGAWVGGLVFHLIAADWIRTSYGGIGLSGSHARSWLIMGFVNSFLWLFAFWLARRFVGNRGTRMVVTLPVTWVAFEFLRRHAWTIIDETGCIWFQLGMTQANVLLLAQIADVAGVWGITFVVAMVNGALFDAAANLTARHQCSKRTRTSRSIAGAGIILGASLVYGWWRLSQPVSGTGPTVCLMPAGTIQQTPASAEDISRLAAQTQGADLLLWSETVIELLSDDAIDKLARFASSASATCVVGCIRLDSKGGSIRKYNSVAVVDSDRGLLGYYDKTCLVPWTEFMPRMAPLIFPRAISELTRGTDYRGFTWEERLHQRTRTFAATICYDTCFPGTYRRLLHHDNTSAAPEFFVVASRETADLSSALQRSILAQARFRAIECRRAVVRNVECGYSGLIDSCGRLVNVDQGLFVRVPTLVGPVPVDERVSLYARLGDWLPLLTSGVLVMGMIFPRRFPRKRL